MAYLNKIFTNNEFPKSKISRDRWNREYMMSAEVAESFNTYRTHGVFPTLNDVGNITWDKNNNNATLETEVGAPGVQSLFNKYSAVLTGGGSSTNVSLGDSKEVMASNMSQLVTGQNGITEFRFSNNTPLLESPEVREALEENAACSVKDLVKASAKGVFGRCVYSYSDFMYCKYLGVVPNNYLITLRRFPIPVTDAMLPVGQGRRNINDSTNSAKGASPVGTMVTWMGVSGNNMEDILKYSFNMPYKESTADWKNVTLLGGGASQQTPLNGIAAIMNPVSREAWIDGTEVPAIDNVMTKYFGMGKFIGKGAYKRQSDHWDSSKVYGPIDRIKKNYQRSSEGIDWKWKITLNFEYELRAYNGINPKQAMLDLIANILAVTYTNGEFWKGGYYGFELGTSSAYQNMDIFKRHTSYTGWMNRLTGNLADGTKSVGDKSVEAMKNAGTNIAEAIKKLFSNTGAFDMILSGIFNKLGRPERYAYPSLLSESPVGLWHLTIGNPRRPIMVAGNMVITNTTITHSGPLGLDDFPENLKVTIELDRGKPRDIYGIEALYMKGNDRIFHSMSGAVLDMYNAAAVYKGGVTASETKFDSSSTNLESAVNQSVSTSTGDFSSLPEEFTTTTQSADTSTIFTDVLLEAFGDPDTTAIVMSASEQAEGYFSSLEYVEDTGSVNGVSTTTRSTQLGSNND